MWLKSSSIGRKLIMAITGVCLVLFVTFHAVMNGVALFWPSAYNAICAFLGANWYALIASIGLAALFVIHILYALWLTVQNRRARGTDRYAVTSTPKQVEWASKNMLVLGIVVVAFLIVHLIQFWAKMQLAEILHCPVVEDGVVIAPQSGTLFLQLAFSQWWTPVVYIIGFVALWFHMNHGFWSMFQTAGWDNDTWLPRLKCIGCWWTTIVVALFIAQAIVFTVQANRGTYLTCPALIEQYNEFNSELAGHGIDAACTNGHADCDKHKHGDCDGKHQHGDCDKHKHADCKEAKCDKAECDKAECKDANCDKANCDKANCDKAECKDANCDKADCKSKKAECDGNHEHCDKH